MWRASVILWWMVERLETMMSFGLSAIAAGLAKAVGNWSWPEVALVFGGAFFFLLPLFALLGLVVKPWAKAKRVQPQPQPSEGLAESKKPSPPPVDEKAMPSWLEGVLHEDKERLASRVYGRVEQWFFTHIDTTEPYIEVIIRIINASIFSLRLTGVEGQFSISQIRCNQFAQMEGASRIPHGESGNIHIRQPISKETAGLMMECRKAKGSVDIDLQSCLLIIEAEEEQLEHIGIGAGHNYTVEVT